MPQLTNSDGEYVEARHSVLNVVAPQACLEDITEGAWQMYLAKSFLLGLSLTFPETLREIIKAESYKSYLGCFPKIKRHSYCQKVSVVGNESAKLAMTGR